MGWTVVTFAGNRVRTIGDTVTQGACASARRPRRSLGPRAGLFPRDVTSSGNRSPTIRLTVSQRIQRHQDGGMDRRDGRARPQCRRSVLDIMGRRSRREMGKIVGITIIQDRRAHRGQDRHRSRWGVIKAVGEIVAATVGRSVACIVGRDGGKDSRSRRLPGYMATSSRATCVPCLSAGGIPVAACAPTRSRGHRPGDGLAPCRSSSASHPTRRGGGCAGMWKKGTRDKDAATSGIPIIISLRNTAYRGIFACHIPAHPATHRPDGAKAHNQIIGHGAGQRSS